VRATVGTDDGSDRGDPAVMQVVATSEPYGRIEAVITR
jgi:hypothetical protein